MAEETIDWPWQYSFPPFFTLQPNEETRSRQILSWRNLVLEYFKITKQSTMDIRESVHLPLFNNTAINRKLDTEFILAILNDLHRTNNAAPCDKSRNRWEIYWHTLEEWGVMYYNFACNNGLVNTVLTLYELTQGDDVQGEEFSGLDVDVVIKALRTLESQGKCEVILIDDQQGVKFFN